MKDDMTEGSQVSASGTKPLSRSANSGPDGGVITPVEQIDGTRWEYLGMWLEDRLKADDATRIQPRWGMAMAPAIRGLIRWCKEGGLSFLRPAPEPIICITCRVVNDAGEMLLIESTKEGRAWEMPGGKRKKGETIFQGLSRELREESGIEVHPNDWDVVDVFPGLPIPGAPYASTIVLAKAVANGTPKPGTDAKSARWCPVTDVPGMDLSDIASKKHLLDYVVSVLDSTPPTR